MQNWQIDPKTGDYVLEGGAPVQTNSLTIPAYFRTKIKRQRWLYAPDSDYGSDYFTVSKRPSENGNQRLENIGAKALQPMVDDGRALQVEVTVVENRRDAAGLQVTIVDAAGEVEQETFPGLGS